jgi:branched-chain amino acid transport system permease protein
VSSISDTSEGATAPSDLSGLRQSAMRETAVHVAGKLVIALAVVLAPLPMLWGNNYALNILTTVYLMAGLASAWNIIGGFGGQFSLAHGVFFAAGAYTSAQFYLKYGISPWITGPIAAILVGGAAALIAWPTFRLRGPFFAIATMALNEVAFVFANYSDKLTGGARGLLIPFKASFDHLIFVERWKYCVLMFGFLALTVAVATLVRNSRLGYYLLAVREDDDCARASGVNVTAVKLWGMAISATLTSLGGTLFAMYIRFLDPPTLLSLPDVGVKFALLSLIGGIGTIWGPMLGAFLIIPAENWIRASLGGFPGAHLVILGLLLMLAALFLKRGLVGAVSTFRQHLRFRNAQ